MKPVKIFMALVLDHSRVHQMGDNGTNDLTPVKYLLPHHGHRWLHKRNWSRLEYIDMGNLAQQLSPDRT